MAGYDIAASQSTAITPSLESSAGTVFNFGAGVIGDYGGQDLNSSPSAVATSALGGPATSTLGPISAGGSAPYSDSGSSSTGGISFTWVDLVLIGVIIFVIVRKE